MARDQHVPQMPIRGTFARSSLAQDACAFGTHVLNARLHQLEAHVNGESNRYETHQTCSDEVENPDIFMVCGHEPAGKEARPFVIMSRNGCIGHVCLLFIIMRGRGLATCPFDVPLTPVLVRLARAINCDHAFQVGKIASCQISKFRAEILRKWKRGRLQ